MEKKSLNDWEEELSSVIVSCLIKRLPTSTSDLYYSTWMTDLCYSRALLTSITDLMYLYFGDYVCSGLL